MKHGSRLNDVKVKKDDETHDGPASRARFGEAGLPPQKDRKQKKRRIFVSWGAAKQPRESKQSAVRSHTSGACAGGAVFCCGGLLRRGVRHESQLLRCFSFS